MFQRELEIPGFLHELHGERASVGSIVLVYSAGLAAAAAYAWELTRTGLVPWKIILGCAVMFDVAGGVVANLSTSTNHHYRNRPGMRKVFLLLHFLQPLALYFVFPDEGVFLGVVYVFTIASSLIVDSIRRVEVQQNTAAFLLVLGLACSMMVSPESVVVFVFAPLFMVKLITGFSVRRPSFLEKGV